MQYRQARIFQAQAVDKHAGASDQEGIRGRHGQSPMTGAVRCAVDLQGEGLAIPLGCDAVPLAGLYTEVGAGPRFPAVDVHEETEVAAFCGRIDSELIFPVFDEDFLRSLGNTFEKHGGFEAKSRCQPQIGGIGYSQGRIAGTHGLTVAAHRQKGGRPSLEMMPMAGGIPQIAVEKPTRHTGVAGLGIVDAHIIENPVDITEFHRCLGGHRDDASFPAGLPAVDADPDLRTAPACLQMIPDTDPGGNRTPHSRFPVVAIDEKGKLSAFVPGVDTQLIFFLFDDDGLPTRADGGKLYPALEPQAGGQPQAIIVRNHDGTVAAAQPFAAFPVGIFRCLGHDVIAMFGCVEKIVLETPPGHRAGTGSGGLPPGTSQTEAEKDTYPNAPRNRPPPPCRAGVAAVHFRFLVGCFLSACVPPGTDDGGSRAGTRARR